MRLLRNTSGADNFFPSISFFFHSDGILLYRFTKVEHRCSVVVPVTKLIDNKGKHIVNGPILKITKMFSLLVIAYILTCFNLVINTEVSTGDCEEF